MLNVTCEGAFLGTLWNFSDSSVVFNHIYSPEHFTSPIFRQIVVIKKGNARILFICECIDTVLQEIAVKILFFGEFEDL